MRRRVRLFANRFGVELLHYPDSHPLFRLSQILEWLDIQVVLDVGANDGSYATELRRLGYAGHIHSFEPLAKPFDRLRSKARRDPEWTAHNFALGRTPEVLDINVAGNQGASSSFLTMDERHRQAAPQANYVATEQVQVRCMDDVWKDISPPAPERVHLKLDVQGYEQAVIDGAQELLGSAVRSMQIELSLVRLYEGAMTWRQGLDFADRNNFRLAGMIPGFVDGRTGELMQFDAILVRDDWRERSR